VYYLLKLERRELSTTLLGPIQKYKFQNQP
jgi:hypothetical protein